MALIGQEEINSILSVFPEGAVGLDLETTGLSPILDSIIEIAAIKITSSGQVETFERLINPRRTIPVKTIAIHHITNEMVNDAPYIEDVMPLFMDFIGNLPLVAHNAQFDIGFIVKVIHGLSLPFNSSHVYDSCKLARVTLKGPANFKLGTLATFYNIALNNHHRALDDACACLCIFEKSLKELRRTNLLSSIGQKGHVFNINDFDRSLEVEMPKRLESIIPALQNQEIIEIEYQGGSLKKQFQFRPIKPFGILPLPHGLVLSALCIISNQIKSFSLKKIKSVRFLSQVEIRRWEEHLKSFAEEAEDRASESEEITD